MSCYHELLFAHLQLTCSVTAENPSRCGAASSPPRAASFSGFAWKVGLLLSPVKVFQNIHVFTSTIIVLYCLQTVKVFQNIYVFMPTLIVLYCLQTVIVFQNIHDVTFTIIWLYMNSLTVY